MASLAMVFRPTFSLRSPQHQIMSCTVTPQEEDAAHHCSVLSECLHGQACRVLTFCRALLSISTDAAGYLLPALEQDT